MEIENYISNSEKETIDIGQSFAHQLQQGDVVALNGDLGAGKTEFIKGICNYFEVNELVTSPTFTIMNQYSGEDHGQEISIYHIDLYRIQKKEELDEIGFRDCICSNKAIKLVEWADKCYGQISGQLFIINIIPSQENENQRFIKIEKKYGKN